MLPIVAIAIHLLHPTLDSKTVDKYVDVIQEQSLSVNVNPLTFVAIIEHESKFDPRAISGDLFDYGLMQVRAQYYRGRKEWLLNGETNIKAGAHVIQASVDMCRKHLKREPRLVEWYSLYAGQGKYHFCTATPLTRQVANYQTCLETAVSGETDIKQCKKIYP